MKLNRNDYTVEAAAGGGFYAYFMNNVLCSAYGETPDEACENLEQEPYIVMSLKNAILLPNNMI
jgi:hypothetical protein